VFIGDWLLPHNLSNAHQVGPGGAPSSTPLSPALENLNEATNCVTPKRVSGLGVLFVATQWLEPGRVIGRPQLATPPKIRRRQFWKLIVAPSRCRCRISGSAIV
jgi:hypothetical protein